jgi:hypothetical protein
MQFISPLFLIALLVLAIPILIHLFYFRKYKRVLFSDIKFLKEIKEQKSTVENLKKKLILACRLLALFFLVLAFAQPFFGKKNSGNDKGNVAACVYIDNSFSTQLKYSSTNVLDMQIQKAKEIASTFNLDDRLYLLTNDMSYNQGWMNKQDFLSALDNINASAVSKNVDEILNRQNVILNNVTAQQKWRVLISDFQRNMIQQQVDTTFETYILPIQAENTNNIYIDSCWLDQPLVLLNMNNKLKYKIYNSSNAGAKEANVSLKINQQTKSIHKLSIASQSSMVDSFSFSVTQAGNQNIEIFVEDYPITYDNHFYASLNVSKNEYVLSIHDDGTPNYIQSIFQNDAYFILEQNHVNQINYSSINKYKFIVLNHVHDISSGLSIALKSYVSSGGILFIVPSKNINISSYNTLLSNLGIGSFAPLKQQNLTVQQLNLREQIFKGIFLETPKNIDYPKVTQYYPINISAQSQHYTIIPTNSSTALIDKFVVQNGIVYIQTAPLDQAYTDLSSKAIFAPIVYNMAIYQKNTTQLYYTIGNQQLIEIKNDKPQNFNRLILSNGKAEFVPESRIVGNMLLLNPNTSIKQDGVYNVSKDGVATAQSLAFNYNRKESILDFLSKDDIKQKFNYPKFNILDIKKANIGAQVKQLKGGIILWKICVILALIFLLLEILIIRFMKS